ncbi:glycoside hydrolase family 5 protein [Marinobacter zhanjiangensis]|uniref:Cellulase n=1 Tax=Marinobacter zhanjiangensis TaxID=578215 RepID=A0ABQ3B0V1_9GAMM|nr:glycoside hydrolase family 5 protein [Marinobacter zhanjiangensis]GGY70099.1 cellulase [Marinobacter zhanjiangensis]
MIPDRLPRVISSRWAARHLLPWFAGLVLAFSALSPASAICLQEAPLRGVNLSGAEFNSKSIPGQLFTDYTYPSPSDFEYFAEKGANLIRLPVRWERVQRELGGELHDGELNQIRKAVANARNNGQCLLIDLHNYGGYEGDIIGKGRVTTAHLVDVWSRLASALNDTGHVALGLMNEPFTMDIADWATVAQDTVTALRDQGASHLILVSGGRWSGVHEWFKDKTGSSNAVEFADFSDPLDRSVLEVHQYLNEGYSGTRADCLPPEHFDDMFSNISRWADDNEQRLFLGEFGSPPREECLASLERLLELSNDPLTWRGWAYWAAGAWWGDYFLTVHPDNGQDRPQMSVLEDYFQGWSCADVDSGRCPKPPENLAAD